jgi:SPP1 gp7 family putative phage head morphogenesis protein
MTISTNPTKTRGIEKMWLREINRRFARFSREVIAALKLLDRQQLITNAFDADPEQLRAYIAFFRLELESLILGTWQSKYQQRSYQLAIDRAMAELARQGLTTTITDADFRAAQSIGRFTATPALGLTALDIAALPIHQETLGFLFTRSFEALEGITDSMGREIRTILFQGVEQGIGTTELTRQIKARIKIGRSRAALIARTETIQAYQRGSINQIELASEALDEPIGVRWLTVRDDKVRHLHAGWHGRIFTPINARKNIAISPWNCRCGLAPVIKEADTEVKREKFDGERKELQALTS